MMGAFSILIVQHSEQDYVLVTDPAVKANWENGRT